MRSGLDHQRFLIVRFIFLLACLLNFPRLYSQVKVSIPDSTVCPGIDFMIPVYVTGLSAEDSVIAYQLCLRFDSSLVEVYGVSNDGTMTRKWGSPFINVVDTACYVAGFTSNQGSKQIQLDTNRLVQIGLRIIKDSVFTTQIEISSFMLFGLDGDIEPDTVSGSEIDVVLNLPPVIKKIPDMLILEDTDIDFNVAEYVFDFNHSIFQLDIVFSDREGFQFSNLSTEGMIKISPPVNWAGTDTLTLTVTDPAPFFESDRDTFAVTVLPVDDPPGHFELISPPDSTVFSEMEEYIEFTWHRSENVDQGDTIIYILMIGYDSLLSGDGVSEYSAAEDTTIRLNSSEVDEGWLYWGVRAEDKRLHPKSTMCDRTFAIGIMTDVEDCNSPSGYMLESFPNPFNSEMVVRYSLPFKQKIRIEIFNALGHRVMVLVDETVSAGLHEMKWNGKDEAGDMLPSGIYLVLMRSKNFFAVKRALLLK